MASFLYDSARQSFLQGDLDWLVDDVRAILVDSADYTPVQATHDFLNDVPAAARVAVSAALAGKTATAGVADANDVLFSGVTGDQFEAVVIYKHTGTETTSNLIAYIDGFTPLTPNTGDITVAWDNGANKIFKL